MRAKYQNKIIFLLLLIWYNFARKMPICATYYPSKFILHDLPPLPPPQKKENKKVKRPCCYIFFFIF